MEFIQPFSDQKQPGDPDHDPAGPLIQTHELKSGELLITFAPEWMAENDWRLGDQLVWNINEETGALTLTCPEAQARKEANNG